MMEKTFSPWALSEGEQPAVPLFDDSHREMSKVASSLDSVPDLKKYIGTAKPEKGWYFLLIHANGSDEVWGPNKKGDSFPLSDLVPADPKADYGYRTFATNALGYVHHRNTPDRWTGRVLMADYNRDLGRVELIAKFNRARLIEEMAPYFAEALDKGELPAVSMGCFSAGTLVTLSDGSRKNIEDIQVGDEVLTHMGRGRKVTELHVRTYTGSMYSIRTSAGMPTHATEEHPFLAYSRDQAKVKGPKGSPRWLDTVVGAPEWTHAKCLADTFLVEPFITEVLTPDYVTPAFARLVGYYLSEGHVLRDKDKEIVGLELTVNKKDHVLTEIHALCDAFGTKGVPVIAERRNTPEALSISIFDKRLAELCYEHAGGYAKKKKLSYEAMRWHPELQREMLGAYLNGDGHGLKSGAVQASTASADLAWQLTCLLPRLGIIPSINCLTHKAGSGFSRAATYEWVVFIGKQFAQELHDVCSKIVHSEVEADCHRRKKFGDHVLTPVKDILETHTTTTVYNFEVEEDNSFVANGLAVHNCRVAHDQCSICGHKASTPAQYCTHILHERLNTYKDGRRVRMLNIRPRFHDISLVSSPADPDARTLLKIAELDTKLSAIEKIVPASTVGSLRRTNREELAAALSTEHDPDISLDKLLKASRWGKHASLSAFTGAGVILRPHEYMALEFACGGKYAEAAEAYGCRLWVPVLESNSTTPAFGWKTADADLVAEILSAVAPRSVYVPALDNRAQGLKMAAESIGSLEHGPQGSDAMAVSYSNYRKTAEDLLLSGKAAEWALSQPKILVQVLGRDIPIFLKQAAIDSPRAVFAAVVRGYNVTTLA